MVNSRIYLPDYDIREQLSVRLECFFVVYGNIDITTLQFYGAIVALPTAAVVFKHSNGPTIGVGPYTIAQTV